ncbi:IS30 family transposase [Patescibacteria group bacterium]|nr:IS30 family transposase [Patescibacteria group bacterium]
MKTYKRLCFTEREEISRRLYSGESKTDIACATGRDASTIGREIRRGNFIYQFLPDHYRAEDGELCARIRKQIPKKPRRLDTNEQLRNYVFEKLKLYWSPEQIAESLKRDYPEDTTMRISHESIYSYIYVLPRGSLKKELKSYLRQNKRKRGNNKKRYEKQGQIPDMISIGERPKEVEDRTVPGHWEGDLIIGKDHQSAIGTLVERTTRTTIIVPLKNKDAVSVRKAFAREANKLPQQMKLSMTYDRGKEMAEHKLFTKNTKMKVYFAHPYSSWERGTNENTNGLIRQFFPKRTDFRKISKYKIKKVQDLLNGRPRKILEWQTPYEVFKELLH